MVRPRTFSLVMLAALATSALSLAACSSPPEQQLLQKFFAASRMRDNTTLQNFSTVSFSPTQDGTVQKFTIASVGAETRKTLQLRELAAAVEAIEKATGEFDKKKKEYQDANSDAIQRVLKAEAANQRLKGKDLEVQAAWRKWRDEVAGSQKKITEARKALGGDRVVTEISAFDARNQVDVTKFDGELISKELVLDAEVKPPEGQTTATKKLYVTMMRADLRNGPDGKAVSGRWVITHMADHPPAGS